MEFEANLPSLPPEIKRMPAALHGFDRGLGTAEGVAHEDWPISCQSCCAMREGNENMRLCANRFGRSYGLTPTPYTLTKRHCGLSHREKF